MEIICSLRRFKPWGPAVNTLEKIESAGKLDALEDLLDMMYEGPIDGGHLNDILSGYDDDINVLEMLGLEEPELDECVLPITKVNNMMSQLLNEDKENVRTSTTRHGVAFSEDIIDTVSVDILGVNFDYDVVEQTREDGQSKTTLTSGKYFSEKATLLEQKINEKIADAIVDKGYEYDKYLSGQYISIPTQVRIK